MNLPEYGMVSPRGALAFVIVLAVLMCMHSATRRTRALATSLGLTSLPAQRPRLLCATVAALLLTCAATRPYLGVEEIKVEARGDDVIFLVDISRSMYATDIPPSRLEVAKRKIKDLVALMTTQGAAARFGITVFAGAGYTVCPITTDRGVLGQFVDIISPDLVTSLGSNLKAGVETAVSKLDDTTKTHSRVILISDGEDEFLDARGLIGEIRARGVRFDVLGLGTPQGSEIVLPNGSKVFDQHRTLVVSSLREEPLQAIAKAGGGEYVRATIDDSDIGVLAGYKLQVTNGARVLEESSFRSYREFGSWLALAALFTLFLSACIRGANPLIVLLMTLLPWSASVAHAQTPPAPTPATSNISPSDLYTAGDFQGAAKAYQQQLDNKPHDRALLQGLGSALYKLGQYERAEEIFGQLAQEATSGRQYFESVYNQGNALLKMKQFQHAIDAFTKALDVKPNDEQASHNLEVARALLEEEKRRALEPTPTPTDTPTSSPTAERAPSPESTQPSPSPASSPSPQNATASPNETSGGTPQQTSEATAQSASPSSAHETASGTFTAAITAAPETVAPDETTGNAAATPTPPQRLKESLDKHSEEEDPKQVAPHATTSATDASIPEVDAWLQSLPDSPLLVRRHNEGPKSNSQTW